MAFAAVAAAAAAENDNNNNNRPIDRFLKNIYERGGGRGIQELEETEGKGFRHRDVVEIGHPDDEEKKDGEANNGVEVHDFDAKPDEEEGRPKPKETPHHVQVEESPEVEDGVWKPGEEEEDKSRDAKVAGGTKREGQNTMDVGALEAGEPKPREGVKDVSRRDKTVGKDSGEAEGKPDNLSREVGEQDVDEDAPPVGIKNDRPNDGGKETPAMRDAEARNDVNNRLKIKTPEAGDKVSKDEVEPHVDGPKKETREVSMGGDRSNRQLEKNRQAVTEGVSDNETDDHIQVADKEVRHKVVESVIPEEEEAPAKSIGVTVNKVDNGVANWHI